MSIRCWLEAGKRRYYYDNTPEGSVCELQSESAAAVAVAITSEISRQNALDSFF